MRSVRQRLFALLVGFALAMLGRPGELLAKQGAQAEDAGDSVQTELRASRRSGLGLSRPQLADQSGTKAAPAVAGSPLACRIAAATEGPLLEPAAVGCGERRQRVHRLRTRGPPTR